MRTLIFLLLPVVMVPLAASAQWREFFDPEEFFSVNFPAEPDVREIEFQSEYGATVPAKVYSVVDGDQLYSVTVVNYADAEGTHTELPDGTDDTTPTSIWVYDQRASVSFAARALRLRGGEVTYDAWHHIDRVEGLQLQITNPDGSRTYAGTYYHNSRLYIVEATGPEVSILAQGLFQQSLYFLDDEGIRIRYELFPDGSRVRTPVP
ncbi:hypothetical protein [Candidatus Rariloculus sp.]|uniref:hypothetical protein n=1 Tax=Candidatus Rariloculus sp. TaxID=3101265 RepID=UPI003D148B00